MPVLDVSIIGAGPAGSSAAKMLAEQGLNVGIFEKEKLPRHKHCGGGISVYCLDYLKKLDVDAKDASLQEYTGFNLNFGNINAGCDLNKTIGYGVYREDFDFLITKNSQSAGAKLYNKKFNGFKKEDAYLKIITDKGSYKTRFILGADGINSTVRKCLGIPYTREKMAISLEAEIKTNRDRIEKYENRVTLDLKYFNEGYAWAFPKLRGKTINFGVGTFLAAYQKMNIPLKTIFLKFLKDKGFKTDIKNIHGALLPFGGTVNYFGKDNVLLIGDAAGLVSPLSGEGIPYALESGITAANCLIDGFDYTSSIVLEYEKRLSHLTTELNKYAILLQKKLYGSESHRKLIVKICKENPILMEEIGKIFMHIISYKKGVEKFSTLRLFPKVIKTLYNDSILSPVEPYTPKPVSYWVRM